MSERFRVNKLVNTKYNYMRSTSVALFLPLRHAVSLGVRTYVV